MKLNRKYEHAKHCATMGEIHVMMAYLVAARLKRAIVFPRSFLRLWGVFFLGMAVAVNPLGRHWLIAVSLAGAAAGFALISLSLRDAARIHRSSA